MNRRTFLKALPLGAASALGGHAVWREMPPAPGAGERAAEAAARPAAEPAIEEAAVKPPDPLRDEGGHLLQASAETAPAPDLRTIKIRDFDRTYEDDLFLVEERLELLRSTAAHLERAERTIGFGHFNVVSFDELLRYGRRYSAIGRFTRQELDFLEEIFFADATRYGFFGAKVTHEMTAQVPRQQIRKVAGTGHYLFKGEPLAKYERIRRDLGANVVLTSGIRGVVKQYHLFLAKAVDTEGNLSQASRSLAPPGYSYHAAGDFDVGKVGLGADNFTAAFAETDEFKRMIDLGYIEIRYTETNPFGVRHEPWHIKII